MDKKVNTLPIEKGSYQIMISKPCEPLSNTLDFLFNIPSLKGCKINVDGSKVVRSNGTVCNQWLVTGYKEVSINKKKYYVHKLVAETFIGIPDPSIKLPIVHHKDGNKLNNHYSNLKYIDLKSNKLNEVNDMLGKIKLPHLREYKHSKIKFLDKVHIYNCFKVSYSVRELAIDYNTSETSIRRAIKLIQRLNN